MDEQQPQEAQDQTPNPTDESYHPTEGLPGNDQPQETQQEEFDIVIGEDAPPEVEKAPPWVADLRKRYREADKERQQLKKELQQIRQPETTVGARPKLEDFDYDEDNFANALSEWYTRKQAVEAEEARKQREEESAMQSWQQRLQTHEQKKEELRAKIPHYDDAEALVLENLSQVQLAAIVRGSSNSALTIGALGRNPELLRKLAAITDPIEFSFAVSKIEDKANLASRKNPPPPETVPTQGSPSAAGVVNSELEKLRAEASKTGNFNKVLAYQRELARGQR